MSINENPEVPVKRLKTDESSHDGSEAGSNQSFPPDDTSGFILVGEAADQKDAINREWVEKLQQLLSCPVCYEMIRPSVDICSSNGHSVCLKCRTRLMHCPICNAEFVKATNIMLAQIAEYVKYPCPNAVGGCKELSYLRDEEAHLKECLFIVHRCKIDNCEWMGKRDQLQLHVESFHQEDIWKKDWSFSGSRKFEEDEASSDEFGKFLIIQNELFWMLSSYDCDKKKLYKNFQYIGHREMAKDFVYQICLKSSDDRRQFLFKSVMDDDTRHGNEVFDSPNCTVIDFSVLRSFSTKSPDSKLKYHYFITKTT